MQHLWKRISIVAIATLAGAAIATPSLGAAKQPNKKEIEQIVHDYIVNNPEVLIEASQALQEKEAKQAKSKAMQGIQDNKDNLFSDANSPVAGNPNGDVILVEFFDYQCGHCKQMQSVIETLLETNKNVKLIYKEFPIYGASSNYASKAALAAAKQNKYLPFHDALFKISGPLNETKVLDAAKSVGLNVEQLKKDMDSTAIKEELSNNYNLAKALSLIGTPSFVLSNQALTQFDFIPGAAPADMFQEAIDKIAADQKPS